MRLLRLALSMLASLVGCGADPSTPGLVEGAGDSGGEAADTGTPASSATVPLGIEVGQGIETTFEAGGVGDLLVLYFGPQGGWHVDAAALVAGVGPSTTIDLRWKLTVLDEGWVVGDPEIPLYTNLQP